MISIELKTMEWFEVLEALALYTYALETSKIKDKDQIRRVKTAQECIKAQIK